MPLSAEMYVFFDKVAKKNFSLACDVYYALTNGQEITPSIRATKKEEPAHSCAGFFSNVYRSALLDYSSNISTAI